MRQFFMISLVVASGWFFIRGIPWLRKLFPRPVWSYASDTPVERLHSHHRIAIRCVYFCFACIVGSVSSLIQIVVLGWRAPTTWFLVAYGAGMVVSVVPAIVFGAWSGEVERECRARDVAVPSAENLRSRVRSDAIGLFFWIVVAIASPWVAGFIQAK